MATQNRHTKIDVAVYEDLGVVDIKAETLGGPRDGAAVHLRCSKHGAMRLYRALGRALATDTTITKELVDQ